jgi:oligosaccharide repeat unit polymerase
MTPITMIWLLKIAGERASKISMVTVVVYSMYVFSVVGTFPLFFMLDEYRVNIGIVKKDVIVYVLVYSAASIFCLLLGVIFSRRVLKLVPRPILSMEIKNLSPKQMAGLITALLLMCFVLYVYLKKIDSVAILVVIRDSVVAAALARSDMGNNLASGGAHWYTLILSNIGPLITCAFYAAWLIKKNKIRLILFGVTLIVSSFVAVMATEKAPFINLMTLLIMTYFIIRSDGVVPLSRFLYFGLVALVVLVGFYMLFMGSQTLGDALQNVVSRAFSGSIAPAYFYLEHYPVERGYLFGTTFPNPGGILPFTPERYTVDLRNWVFPELAATGVVGTMPTVFWAEAYVNFGWIGVGVVSFLIGVIMSFVLYFVSSLALDPITIALNIWLIGHYKKLSITGFSGYLYDFYFWGVVSLTLTLIILTGPIKFRRKKSKV